LQFIQIKEFFVATVLAGVHKMKTSSIPYDLTLEERQGYLYACIKVTELDRNIALDCLAEIVARCADIRCKRMLVERDAPAGLDDTDFLISMTDLVRMSAGVKIAFVNKHVNRDPLSGNGMNGHAADYKHFRATKPAETWLMRTPVADKRTFVPDLSALRA